VRGKEIGPIAVYGGGWEKIFYRLYSEKVEGGTRQDEGEKKRGGFYSDQKEAYYRPQQVSEERKKGTAIEGKKRRKSFALTRKHEIKDWYGDDWEGGEGSGRARRLGGGAHFVRKRGAKTISQREGQATDSPAKKRGGGGETRTG